MPANLTADYLAADQAYRQAHTQPEKVAALEQMLAALPKHKGTEKLYAELKRKLSSARKESARKTGGHAPAYYVKHEGAAQVALIGPPNAGKSQLVCAATHARAEVAAYPFTTRMPTPGMMRFENVAIQLVDTPAISADFTEPWMPQLIRAAHMSALVVDANDPSVLDEAEFVLGSFEGWAAPPPKLFVANKVDQPDGSANAAALQSLYRDRFSFVAVSALTGAGLDEFARKVFDALDLVRFYSKAPGEHADLDVPYVLHRGATIHDAAAQVHRDFAEHLKYAKLFRKSDEHHGLMVERAHVVEDEAVLEFHLV